MTMATTYPFSFEFTLPVPLTALATSSGRKGHPRPATVTAAAFVKKERREEPSPFTSDESLIKSIEDFPSDGPLTENPRAS